MPAPSSALGWLVPGRDGARRSDPSNVCGVSWRTARRPRYEYWQGASDFASGEGSDDIDFDPATKRIYVSGGGGEGSVDVYKENDLDHYESLGRFVSAPGAATARLVPELGEYIVLVRARKTRRAEVGGGPHIPSFSESVRRV